MTTENPMAFPLHETEFADGHPGMTLRDYFAGQALASVAATTASEDTTEHLAKFIAGRCYLVADAMLAARSVGCADNTREALQEARSALTDERDNPLACMAALALIDAALARSAKDDA